MSPEDPEQRRVRLCRDEELEDIRLAYVCSESRKAESSKQIRTVSVLAVAQA